MSEHSNSANKSYRKLLIFVLVFQAILATGWIVYDNYINYLESPNQIALSSLIASGTGLIIVLMVWMLLNASEKESQTTEKKIVSKKSVEAVGSENVSNDALSSELSLQQPSIDEVVLWKFEVESTIFLPVSSETSYQIDYPESASLANKLENTDVLGMNQDEQGFLKEIPALQQKNTLVVAFKKHGDLTGILTCSKSEDTVWTDEELGAVKSTLHIYEAELNAHLALKKVETLENTEQIFLEITKRNDFAFGVFKLETPLSRDRLSLANLNEVRLQNSNDTFNNYFPNKNLVDFLNQQIFEDLEQEGISNFKYDIEGSEEYFQVNLKYLNESAEVVAIALSAVRLKEQSLQKSIYYQLVENSEDLFLTINQNNTIDFLSDSAASFFGISPNRNDTYNILSFVPDYSYEQLIEAINLAKNSQKRQYISSLPFRSFNDEIKKYDCILYPLNSQSTELALELRVIEDRLELADEMHRKQQLLGDLLNLTDEVITVADKEGKIDFVSENMEKYFGYNKESRIGKYVFDFIAPQFVEQVHEDFEKVKSYPTYQGIREIDFLHNNGKWEKVLLKQVNMLENELVNGLVVKFTKKSVVTKEADTKIDSFLLESLLEQQEAPMLLFDRKGEVIFINKSVSNYLGYTPKDVHQKLFIDFIHPIEKRAVLNNLEYLESTPEDSIQNTVQIKDRNGSWLKAEIIIKTLMNQEKIWAYIIQFQDLVKKETDQESDMAFRARFYNALLSGTNNILLFSDINANIKYVNSVAKKILGYQLKGNLLNRIHSSAHNTFKEALHKISKQSNSVEQLDIKIIEKDGNWLPCMLVIRNAIEISNFKGVIIEISIQKEPKAQKTGDSLLNEVALMWLKKFENTGIAFLLESGDVLYKNSTFDSLLEKSTSSSVDIHHAFKEQDKLQKLYKKVLNEPNKEHSSVLQNYLGHELNVSFSAIQRDGDKSIFILSVDKSISDKLSGSFAIESDNQKQITERVNNTISDNIEEVTDKQEDTIKEKVVDNSVSEVEAVVVPELFKKFEGEPELVNANDILEKTISNYQELLSTGLSVVKEFKNDTWIVCHKQFIEELFDTVFKILESGSLQESSGKIMITTQKEDKILSVAISENFSENNLKKATEGFISGEVNGSVKELYDLGIALEKYKGKIKIYSETDRGISVNLYLPDKIGMSF